MIRRDYIINEKIRKRMGINKEVLNCIKEKRLYVVRIKSATDYSLVERGRAVNPENYGGMKWIVDGAYSKSFERRTVGQREQL